MKIKEKAKTVISIVLVLVLLGTVSVFAFMKISKINRREIITTEIERWAEITLPESVELLDGSWVYYYYDTGSVMANGKISKTDYENITEQLKGNSIEWTDDFSDDRSYEIVTKKRMQDIGWSTEKYDLYYNQNAVGGKQVFERKIFVMFSLDGGETYIFHTLLDVYPMKGEGVKRIIL